MPAPGQNIRVGLASSWPAWERYGQKVPHPVAILAELANGNHMVGPISSDKEIAIVRVPVTREIFPSVYPPLSKSCGLCVRDPLGRQILPLEPIDGGYQFADGTQIQVTDIREMSEVESNMLRELIKLVGS